MTKPIQITQEELLAIMLHFSQYSPDVATARTRDRLLEASRGLSPNNELYVIGQKAITEAATAKRELAVASINQQSLINDVATLLKYVQELELGHADDSLRDSAAAIRLRSKRFALVK